MKIIIKKINKLINKLIENKRTMRQDGQKWPIISKLILRITSYEGSFITKIKKFISCY